MGSERGILVALFCVSAATSTLLDAGIVCSNDGSHYALVRALADDHTVIIDRHVAYTHRVDVAFRAGHFYSDRPPGTAFAALPFYLTARAVRLDDGGREAVTCALSILCGALAVVLTFLVGRRVGLTQSGALCAALTLALCTPHRSYSTVLFNHALASCLVMLVLWLALQRRWLWAGVCAGYLCGVDYSAPLVLAPLLLLRPSWPAAAGFCAGLVPMLVYHQVAFGSPLHWSYQYSVPAVFAHHLGSTYGGRFGDGFVGLLFHWKAGLLLYSPVLGLAFFAAPRFARENGRRGLALVLAPLLLLLVTSKHATWGAGGGHDARYLLVGVPILCLLVGAAFERMRDRLPWLALFGALFFASAATQLVKHAVGWSREAAPWIAAFANGQGDVVAFLRWLFPHPLAAAAVVLAGVAVSFSWAWGRTWRYPAVRAPARPE